jgi:hypothetical protein
MNENRHVSYPTAVLDHRPRYVNRQQIGKCYKSRTNWPLNAPPSLHNLTTGLVATVACPVILFPSPMTNLDIQRGSHAACLGQNTSDFTLRHYSMGFQKGREASRGWVSIIVKKIKTSSLRGYPYLVSIEAPSAAVSAYISSSWGVL